jgi:hypothetical protein
MASELGAFFFSTDLFSDPEKKLKEDSAFTPIQS